MKTKKITALLCTLTLALSAVTSAFAAESNTDWGQFLGSPVAAGITTAKIPTSPDIAAESWSEKYTITSEYNGAKFENNACGTPITIGDFLYFTVADGRLLKLDAKTGKVAASAAVSGIPAYFSQIASGDGKIYVPQQTASGVTVSAFSTDTLAAVWTSDVVSSGDSAQQIASPITYYDHHIYFGTYTQDMTTYAFTSGVYASVDTNTGHIAWQQANTAAGYYWNGGAVLGSAIAVADTSGNLSTYNLTTGEKGSTVSVGGPVSSTVTYANGRIYASVKSGTVYSVQADASGIIAETTAKKSAVLGNNITSSPVVYNGRLYVAGGGYGAKTPFSVLNASTLETVYQISGIHSQSSPLVTTAYAKEQNGTVYIYVASYGTANQDGTFSKDSSNVYVIEDKPSQTKASYKTLFTPDIAQSSTQSLTPSRDGMLFYFNDSGTMYAINDSGMMHTLDDKASGTNDTKAPLNSPKTGEFPVASGAVVFILSGAAVVLLRRKAKGDR